MNISSLIIYNFIMTFVMIIFYPVLSIYYKLEISKKYPIWIHCASLGEVKIALRLLSNLVRSLNIKSSEILLTTTTISAKNFAFNFHKDVYILPLDYYFFVEKFIKKVKPKVFIIIETELWPNYITLLKKYGCKIFLLNGRISKRTYIFMKLFNCFFKNVIDKIDYFLVREEIDYIRFLNLGVKKDKLIITGNMKYDDVEEEIYDIKREDFYFSHDDFIIMFGSIREKEEKLIIKFIKKFLYEPNIKFILSARHLKLNKKICRILKKEKITYKLRTQISKTNNEDNFKCLIIDTYGELKKFYQISNIAFVCGSILPYGGQNIIEPASLGKLVIFGKYIHNFLHPAKMLLKNKAAICVKDLDELYDVVRDILKNPQKYANMGENAKITVKKLKGVTQKNIELMKKFIVI
ncbi:MAG: glycosyltransferase [Endomicrobia bacterium]|nr:glycosyltransferase [Endomicrobiia bacterium]